ncbi:hypothetical protein J6590_002662 [Homalodisca vitripennis]|nr:hypothetical protein J6590_002662 [Homalodisca vitripennis]
MRSKPLQAPGSSRLMGTSYLWEIRFRSSRSVRDCVLCHYTSTQEVIELTSINNTIEVLTEPCKRKRAGVTSNYDSNRRKDCNLNPKHLAPLQPDITGILLRRTQDSADAIIPQDM